MQNNNCDSNELFIEAVIMALCNSKGPVIAPIVAFDYLTVSLTMESRVSEFEALDLVFIQDISGSFSDDLRTVNSIIDSLLNSVTDRVPDTQFAITTFCDIPEAPFGEEGDVVFEVVLPLTADKLAVKNAYASILIQNGADTPESQLIALKETALAAMGYRPNSKKVFILLTDAEYHTHVDDVRYPTEAAVVSALNALGVYTIFGVSSSSVGESYTALNTVLGGLITTIGYSSQTLVTAVDAGLSAGQQSLQIPVTGTITNARPYSVVTINAVDSVGLVINTTVMLNRVGYFITGTVFNSLANGSITFTFTGRDANNVAFSLTTSVYKY